DQRLERRIRTQATNAREISIGRVESLQHGIGNGPPAKDVNSAPITLRAGIFLPSLRTVAGRLLKKEVWRWREDAASANSGIQQTARGEGDIAHSFAVHTQPRAAREQAIKRIFAVKGGCDSR